MTEQGFPIRFFRQEDNDEKFLITSTGGFNRF